jgi:hypothetical protein
MTEGELAIRAPAGPVRTGIVDRAVSWLERLPGTAVPWIVAGVVVLALVTHAASWIAGETPFGEPRPELLLPIPFLTFFLLLIVILDGVAQSSFDDFQVSLDEPADVIERLRADLTSIPDIPAIIAIVLWAVIANGSGQGSGEPVVEPPATGIVLAAVWFVTNAALALLVVHTLRQLRQVGRLQAMVERVNLFDPGPINAFSRLTAATAGGILAIGVAFAVVDSSDPSSVGIAVEAVIAMIAIAFFVLPLRGMHGRLAAEKSRLLANANSRLQLVIDRIHRMVDADDLARADELQKTEAALLAERDLYLHLSTWPWSVGVFRGLVTAVMLPIFIGIVLRLMTRVI